jgi:hypothetical protein
MPSMLFLQSPCGSGDPLGLPSARSGYGEGTRTNRIGSTPSATITFADRAKAFGLLTPPRLVHQQSRPPRGRSLARELAAALRERLDE